MPDYVKEAAALNATPPVRYIGEHMGFPMFDQTLGVGSFIIFPGETLTYAFKRAQLRYREV